MFFSMTILCSENFLKIRKQNSFRMYKFMLFKNYAFFLFSSCEMFSSEFFAIWLEKFLISVE